MQLRRARLCLDCDELHEEPQCPVCASEAFVFLTRWVPVDEQRRRRRSAPKPAPSGPKVSHFVKGGAVGLVALAAARWLMRPSEAPTSVTPATGPAGDASDPRADSADDLDDTDSSDE